MTYLSSSNQASATTGLSEPLPIVGDEIIDTFLSKNLFEIGIISISSKEEIKKRIIREIRSYIIGEIDIISINNEDIIDYIDGLRLIGKLKGIRSISGIIAHINKKRASFNSNTICSFVIATT